MIIAATMSSEKHSQPAKID